MYQSEVSSYANYTLSINIQLYSEDSYSAGCISVITIERSSFCDLYNRILLTTLPEIYSCDINCITFTLMLF